MDVLSCTPEEWVRNENELLELLTEDKTLKSLPYLNANDLHDLQDGKLVRFRGMVQDMHGPEFYLEKYEVCNEVTQEKVVRVGRYTDIAECKDNEHVNLEDLSTVRGERQSYVVISVPAVNPWVTNIEKEKYKINTTIQAEASRTKRSLDEEGEKMEVQQGTDAPGTSSDSNKRQCMNKDAPQENGIVSREHILNFPLPDREGKVCHIKVYKNTEDIKLNCLYEFVGFLSVNPILVGKNGDSEFDEVEFQTHNPPPSLVPRIHCVAFSKIAHINPLISIQDPMSVDQMQFIRKELLIVLTQLLLGDELAAEYLIYHLISEVYLRNNMMPLGKFSMNISNIPHLENLDYVREVYKFLENFVTKSHYVSMSLENMNELEFMPKKDYTSNRLTSSILQLSANTHLVLDETKLKPGKLNAAGVNGLKAISSAIQTQKAAYDFTYYQMEFDCDIPFLVMSEGKSMLPSDCHVPLKADDLHLRTYHEILEAANHFLKPELLSNIRMYLTTARKSQYEIAANVQELVQNEFVVMRQRSNNVSAEDLHSLLVLARLVCISLGKHTLDEECWKRACALEDARKERLKK